MKIDLRRLVGGVGLWLLCGVLCRESRAQDTTRPGAAQTVAIDWTKSIVSKSTPTLQVVVNPMLLRGSPMHDGTFAALQALGANYVRYVPWMPYPRQAVAELEPPTDGKTSWDFSHIDPTLEDFMKATEGHSVIINFSTIPAWMFKTKKPTTYPDDPNQVYWHYTEGTELRDPSMQEAADYFARLLSWYTQGGFTDELGKWHPSTHHYSIPYWEVLNEIEGEHKWTPEAYTQFYDAVTLAMRKVDKNLKFVALALASPRKSTRMLEYFLNPKNHRPGTPIDFISYHFYAQPTASETLADWQYSFFSKEEGFLRTVRTVEKIRQQYAPGVKTDLDELGVILPEDVKEIDHPGYVARDEPPAYWNLAGAMYADIFVQTANMGIDVIGESQLVGYKSQFPSVSMMDYRTAQPNARYWILKMLVDNFAPGDKVAQTSVSSADYNAQAFDTPHGRKLLVINKRNKELDLSLSDGGAWATVTYVAPSTGDNEPRSRQLSDQKLVLEPFEVAVISMK